MPRLELRTVFIPGFYYDKRNTGSSIAKEDTITEVALKEDEWVVNVESILPNPQIGVGTRIWVGRFSDA